MALLYSYNVTGVFTGVQWGPFFLDTHSPVSVSAPAEMAGNSYW